MKVGNYGILLSSCAQNLTFRCIELDVVIVAPCVEVGQGFLQTITVFLYNFVSSAYI